MEDVEKKVMAIFGLLLSITAINMTFSFVLIQDPSGAFSNQKVIGTLSSLSITAIAFSGLAVVLFLNFFVPKGAKTKKKRYKRKK